VKIKRLFLFFGRDDWRGYFRSVCICFGYSLLSILLCSLTLVLAQDFGRVSGGTAEKIKLFFSAIVILLPTSWMIAAAQARRVRDTGVSGWWYLAAISIVPLALYFITGHVQQTPLEHTIIRVSAGVIFFGLFAIPTDFFVRSGEARETLPAQENSVLPRDRLAQQLNAMRVRSAASVSIGHGS
jgi:uncharacterized membrane protein YhaH (DUF805 family)